MGTCKLDPDLLWEGGSGYSVVKRRAITIRQKRWSYLKNSDADHNSEAFGNDLSPLPRDRRTEATGPPVPTKKLQRKPSPIITPAWMARYKEATEFKVEHEHLQVPSRTQMSNWLHNQRRSNAQGSLVAQKKALLLDELGFQWIIPVLSPKWLASYNEAITFHTRHGHLQGVPARTPLEQWLYIQRAANAKAKAYPAEKKQLLDSLGFQWTIPIISSDWMASYTEFKAFKTRTGHMHLPSRTPLYVWMQMQRDEETKGTIAVEKKMLLDGLGFTWRENPTRVHLSSALKEVPGIEDVEDDSAKEATNTTRQSTEERPDGDPADIMDTVVLQEGSGQRSSQEDDSETSSSRSREQQSTATEANQKTSGDVSDPPTSADAGEMPAGGELPPAGWIMRSKTRQYRKERGCKVQDLEIFFPRSI
jgi:hypothetical protein